MKTKIVTSMFTGAIKRVKGTPRVKVKQEDYSQYVIIKEYIPSSIRSTIEEITPMLGNYAKKNNLTIRFFEGKDRLTDFYGSTQLANKYNNSLVKVTVSHNDHVSIAANSFHIENSEKPEMIRQIYNEVSKVAKLVK